MLQMMVSLKVIISVYFFSLLLYLIEVNLRFENDDDEVNSEADALVKKILSKKNSQTKKLNENDYYHYTPKDNNNPHPNQQKSTPKRGVDFNPSNYRNTNEVLVRKATEVIKPKSVRLSP